jgi:hypothetical protein
MPSHGWGHPRHTTLPARPYPQPRIIFRPLHQTRSHRVLPEILNLLFQALVRSQHMIERLFLPHRSATFQQFIDPMSRRAFQTLHDLRERKRPTILIAQTLQQQMNVIGHDHDSQQMNTFFTQAMPKNQVTRFRYQDERAARTERNEEILVVLLQMRKPSAISILRRRR